jgi:hypothetical protein
MTNILDLAMEENDADAATIRDYLKELLVMVWEKDESFSGKRPFGNSGWKYDIYRTLATHKLIEAEIDEDGDVIDIQRSEYTKADQLILEAIASL